MHRLRLVTATLMMANHGVTAMEIWAVQCTDTESGEQPAHYFASFGDIQKSLITSYSGCSAVDVIQSGSIIGGPLFTVTGFYGRDGDAFKHVYKCTRLVVHDRATHL